MGTQEVWRSCRRWVGFTTATSGELPEIHPGPELPSSRLQRPEMSCLRWYSHALLDLGLNNSEKGSAQIQKYSGCVWRAQRAGCKAYWVFGRDTATA